MEEKIMMSADRHGGLQNLEVRGIILLRITDPQLTKIAISLANNDQRGFQMQVNWEQILLFCSTML